MTGANVTCPACNFPGVAINGNNTTVDVCGKTIVRVCTGEFGTVMHEPVPVVVEDMYDL